MAYHVEFIRVAPEEMQDVGIAVLFRSGERTAIYCRADHISAEVTRSLTGQGTRFSEATIRSDHPVSPPMLVRFERLDPAEMPDDVSPQVSAVRDGNVVSYFRADMITAEMARALEQLCAEESRYLVQLPVISPAAHGVSPPGRPGR
ncbi:MAG: hypothetical protein M3Y33_17165 [Actinomycetota bacterium]|nr:hypothetical protein [Actinomycetota bacterium]